MRRIAPARTISCVSKGVLHWGTFTVRPNSTDVRIVLIAKKREGVRRPSPPCHSAVCGPDGFAAGTWRDDDHGRLNSCWHVDRRQSIRGCCIWPRRFLVEPSPAQSQQPSAAPAKAAVNHVLQREFNSIARLPECVTCVPPQCAFAEGANLLSYFDSFWFRGSSFGFTYSIFHGPMP
ncbi:hypothetical protein ETAA8_17490 [Anatilimnocola aggregata]|uniref:Uncharacterized protein n=1 Tax=Anatilimnocola aggregata TaxID=2528021 RepID=A0A517Y8U9_9BACT|nr:hypothetical protein ETAA8_17490 [Anatilimnocola aggregata]